MDDILQAAHLLEDKLKQILVGYEFLKDENATLQQYILELQQQLSEKTQQSQEQEKQYHLLKVAKTIAGSSEDTRETKLKINGLIREIDKCIVQLNG